LLDEFIKPVFDFKITFQWREQEYWTLEIDDLYKTNMTGLKKLHKKYFTQTKKYMSYDDAISMICKDAENLGLLEKDVV